MIHFSSGYTNVRPLERCMGCRVATRANVAEARFVQPTGIDCVNVRQGDVSKTVINIAGKSREIAGLIETASGKCHQCIVIGNKGMHREPAFCRSNVIGVGKKLIFVESTRLAKCRETLTVMRLGWIHRLRSGKKKGTIRQLEVQERQSCRIYVRPIWSDRHTAQRTTHASE